MLMAISCGWRLPSGKPIGHSKLSASIVRNPGGLQLSHKCLTFGLAADDPQKCQPPSLLKNPLQDRTIGAVAHGHAHHEVVIRQMVNFLRQVTLTLGCHPGRFGKTRKPFGTRVDASNLAVQIQQTRVRA